MGDKVDDFVRQLEAEQQAAKAGNENVVNESVNEEIGDTTEMQSENIEPEVITEEQSDNQESEAESSDDELLNSIANATEQADNLDTLPKNVQKKINRDNAARKRAEEELARAQEEIARLRMQHPATSNAPVNQFQDDEIDESLPVSEQVKLHLAAEKRQQQTEENIARESARINKLSELAAGKAEKARAVFDDYDDVVAPVVQKFTDKPHILLAIPQCENMGKVMYYLGKNPAYTADLLNITDPLEAAMKIGKLDAKLSQKPATKKVSTAPKPTEKVGSTAGHGSKAPEVLKMDSKTFREFVKTL